MNDIVIFSQNLDEHFKHLRVIFTLFITLRICLTLKKIFQKYFSVNLLEQKINDLKLITAANKLAAIIKLKFLITLNKLDTYLDLTDWLCNYV